MAKWLKDAITQKVISFERKNMINMETGKEYKNAIVGIKRAGVDKVYDIDSYIINDSFRNLIKVVDSYDFEQAGLVEKIKD